MAADDDDRGPAPDPWEEIVAEGLGDEAGEISFQFEEALADALPSSEVSAEPTEPAADKEPGDSFAVEGDASDPEHPVEAATDALLEDWLSAGDGDPATPPLAVYDPEEERATGSSGIDIGTGGSGVGLHGPAEQEEIGADETPFAEAGEQEGAGDGFPAVAAGAAPAAGVAPAKAVRRPAKPAKKSGGIGQVVGVVFGAVLAFPIVAGILIGRVWMGGPDTMGIRKTPLAFLLPPKDRPKERASSPSPDDTDVAGGSALDNLPTVTGSAEPAAGTDAPADEPAPIEPTDVATPGGDMPPATDVAAVDAPGFEAPGLDDLGAKPAPAVPAEPPPLDTAALDAAVGDATALGEALGVVDDTKNGAYAKLRTRWYKALARVAEELVAVENAAATSGRPLVVAPDNVGALHDGICRREKLAAELAALAPDWLAYAKRGSDGIVVPVTFESARRVGPYWAVKASLTGADGQPRDLTVISRREPAAITGDRVVVTGVAIDGTVIWAADVRGMAAGALPPGF